MIEIAIVAPYDGLAAMAREITGIIRKPIRVERALLDEAPALASRLKEEGIQVLISRGGTALVLQDAPGLGLPVVEIRVTAYDVVRAVVKARELGRKIGIIGFENMVLGASTLGEPMDVTIREIVLEHAREAEEKIHAAIAEGVDVVIGGVITVRTAEKCGVRGVLIESGLEAVRQAIDEASRVLWVKKQEHAKAEQFKLILDNVSDGIVAVDDSGRITVFNQAAQRLTGRRADQVVGRLVRDVLPEMELARLQKEGSRPDQTEVRRMNNALVSATSVPIIVDGACVGAISTFQEVSRLQALEKNVRQKLYLRGHVARLRFDDIIGESEEIRNTIARALRFATMDSTVLILGETGTGKELFAQSIHNASARRDGPFVAVNCAAFPETLLESELFGYIEGAFTGARKEGKPGLFELSHHGTIFLDEIAGMPPRLQARLLRVLQEREVMRLGDDRMIPIDVRVMAASNKDLRKLVQEGHFQEDLYYRLDVLKLVVPPLRRRTQDIPLLAKVFLEVMCRKNSLSSQGFTDDALSLLCAYRWPGNVRELKNAVEKCVALCNGSRITRDDVLAVLGDDLRYDSGSSVNHEDALGSLQNMIRIVENEAIARALLSSGGNKTRTAQLLGIDRTTLWRKLRRS